MSVWHTFDITGTLQYHQRYSLTDVNVKLGKKKKKEIKTL
jgi:hypothetical protein